LLVLASGLCFAAGVVKGGPLSVSNWRGFDTNPVVDASGADLTANDPVSVSLGTFASEPAVLLPGAGISIGTAAYAGLLAEFSAYGTPASLVAADGALARKGTFFLQSGGAVAGTALTGKPVYLLITKGTSPGTATEVAILRTSAVFDVADDANPLPRILGISLDSGLVPIVGSGTRFSSVPTLLDSAPRAAISLAQVLPMPVIAVENVATGLPLVSGQGVVDFGVLKIGTSGMPHAFTVRNAGDAALTGLNLGFVSGAATDYSIQGPGVESLAPGASTEFSLVFTPGELGLRGAGLEITGNEVAGSPFVISLAGMGATGRQLFDQAMAAAGLTGPNAGPGAIPFSDGVPNLIKYACGLNAAGPDTRGLEPETGTLGLPALGILPGPPPVIRYEFLRRRNAGLAYAPWQSVGLAGGSWQPVPGTHTVTEINTEWERVVIEKPEDEARFFRLGVDFE
jgi:hypothetical protein